MSEKKLHFWSLRVTASKWTMAVNVGRQISTVSCVLLSVLWALRDENSDLLLREQQSQLVIYKVQVKNKTNTWRVWLLITVCGFIRAAEVVKTVSSFFFAWQIMNLKMVRTLGITNVETWHHRKHLGRFQTKTFLQYLRVLSTRPLQRCALHGWVMRRLRPDGLIIGLEETALGSGWKEEAVTAWTCSWSNGELVLVHCEKWGNCTTFAFSVCVWMNKSDSSGYITIRVLLVIG